VLDWNGRSPTFQSAEPLARPPTIAVSRSRAFLSTFAVFELVFQSHVARLCATGVIDTEDAERWWTDLHEAEASDRFLAAITAFVVAGTKPGTSAVG
jgi:hypothetical protein